VPAADDDRVVDVGSHVHLPRPLVGIRAAPPGGARRADAVS